MIRQGRLRWAHSLPILHLCACFTSILGMVIPALRYLALGWGYIMIIDLPISIVAYALAFKASPLAYIWIIVVGTLWWYVLSRGVQFVFNVLMNL